LAIYALKMRSFIALLLTLLLAPSVSFADTAAPPEQAQGLLRLLPKDSVTERTINVRGQALAYIATAGTLDLFGQDGNRNAKIFYTAYTLKGVVADKRPLTFAFNGGPGAASVYLHLGVAGPKIASFGTGNRDGANVQLIDNPDTWLPFTDLVFVDPIGTGWSRTAKADDAKNYYGVRPDAQVLAKAIALYVANNNRLPSPKYILGESYGGFRAVKISRTLQNDQGIVLSGIVALSPLLEGPLQFGANRFALGAAIQFPSLAAAELERRNTFTPQALAAAERFALNEYLTTLAGPAPQGDAATAFYGKVAQMTGLPVDVVARNRGFIRDAYVKHLRETSKEVVSPYDVAIAMPDPFPETEDPHHDDPVLNGFSRALGGLFVSYARNELGFETPMTYEQLSGANRNWDWHGENQRSASVTNDMREMLALNPGFKMLIVHGTADLVTPYGASKYVVDHLPPLGSPNRVQLKVYRGGHMFYFDPASRKAFSDDARTFYSAVFD
jgi:carboxypeptidase C (cathepsin A)